MAAPVTKDELRDDIKRLEDESQQLQDDWAGRRFDQEAHARFNVLQDERKDKLETLAEIERREQIIMSYADNEKAAENGAEFHTRRANAPSGEDIYDISQVRRVWGDPSVERNGFRDLALRAIEQARFPHLEGSTAKRRRPTSSSRSTGQTRKATAPSLSTSSRPGPGNTRTCSPKAIHGLDVST